MEGMINREIGEKYQKNSSCKKFKKLTFLLNSLESGFATTALLKDIWKWAVHCRVTSNITLDRESLGCLGEFLCSLVNTFWYAGQVRQKYSIGLCQKGLGRHTHPRLAVGPFLISAAQSSHELNNYSNSLQHKADRNLTSSFSHRALDRVDGLASVLFSSAPTQKTLRMTGPRNKIAFYLAAVKIRTQGSWVPLFCPVTLTGYEGT